MRQRRPAAVAAVLAATVLAGCSGEDSSAAPTEADTAADEESTSLPSEQVTEPAGAMGRLALTGWYEADGRAGVSIELRAIEVDGAGHLFVEFEAVTSKGDVELAGADTFLVDDLDNRYPLVRIEDNRNAVMPIDHLATARFAFEGPVDPDATSVTLAINGSDGEVYDANDNPWTSGLFPAVAFRDVPLPGTGMEAAAVRDDGRTVTQSQTIPVDLEAVSTAGGSAHLSEVRVDGRSIELDLLVVNPTDGEQWLFYSEPRLWDDQGFLFRYEGHEEGRRRVHVPANGEAELTLAFRGALHPDAESLQLSIANAGESERSPVFVFENIPLEGQEAPPGDEADAADDNGEDE